MSIHSGLVHAPSSGCQHAVASCPFGRSQTKNNGLREAGRLTGQTGLPIELVSGRRSFPVQFSNQCDVTSHEMNPPHAFHFNPSPIPFASIMTVHDGSHSQSFNEIISNVECVLGHRGPWCIVQGTEALNGAATKKATES